MLEKGDVLVPVETPFGPAEAREAWAHELGTLIVVVGVKDQGRTVMVNHPESGDTADRSMLAIEREYEAAGDSPAPRLLPGAFLARAATEAARVDPGPHGGRDTASYLQALALAVLKVQVEESPARAQELAAVPVEQSALSDPAEPVLGPFAGRSRASREGALTNYPRGGSQRERMIRVLLLDGDMTRPELASAIGISENAVRPRVLELKKGGWVEEVGERDGRAVVRLTVFGRVGAEQRQRIDVRAV